MSTLAGNDVFISSASSSTACSTNFQVVSVFPFAVFSPAIFSLQPYAHFVPARTPQFHCQRPPQLVHGGAEFCGKSVTRFFRTWQMSHRFSYHSQSVVCKPSSAHQVPKLQSSELIYSHFFLSPFVWFFFSLSGKPSAFSPLQLLRGGVSGIISSSSSACGAVGLFCGEQSRSGSTFRACSSATR